VILAGATVRMTGSGMGCPDWPKCFGYLIPPLERSQLDWHPQHTYQHGHVIIVNESLKVATDDFVSGSQFDRQNWSPYTKHDYATFNALHTWIEFLNRLIGAVSGLIVLYLFILSMRQIKRRPLITALALLSVLSMGFQAWLGKTVVDSNLLPSKVSIHMVMALFIIGLLLMIRALSQVRPLKQPDKNLSRLIIVAFILTLIQFSFGIEVRQFVDIQMKTSLTSSWLSDPQFNFYLHRSFSLIILVLNLVIYTQAKRAGLALKYIHGAGLCILGEIILGVMMYYVDFPWGTQPLHLLLATALFGFQLYWILRIKLKPWSEVPALM
jgi:cytochrome c oxidase assembly protein subunit 15